MKLITALDLSIFSTQTGGNSKNSKQDEGRELEMGIPFPEYPVPGSQIVGMTPK